MVANARTPPIFVACQRAGDSNARDTELCGLSDHRQTGARRRHSPAAMYANTQLFGQAAAVCARTQFHATGMPRALCLLLCVRKTCAERVSFSAVFSRKKHLSTHRRGLDKMLTTPRPQDFLRLPSLLHGRRRVLSVAQVVAV